MRLRDSKFWIGALAVATVIALLVAGAQYRQARLARLQLEAVRQRALFTLISHVENMEGNIAKARAAGSPQQQVTFLTASWSHSQAAADNLAQISPGNVDLTPLKTFLATVGDYALVLSQKVARGDPITGSEWAELERLENSVKDLAGALASTGKDAVSRGFGVGRRAGIIASVLSGFAGPASDPLYSGFSEIGTMVQSVPSPIYDGPFSQGNLTPKPLLQKGPPISADAAKQVALEFLARETDFQSVRVEQIAGAIPAYLVTSKRSDGSEVSTAVARDGGQVIWAQDGRKDGPAAMNIDSARRSAQTFLEEKGFRGMVETGWRRISAASGRVMISYVPEVSTRLGPSQEPVRLYPDTVKVEVSLSDGKVVAFDQRAYLTTHRTRTFPEPLIDREEARAKLRSSLKVEGQGRLAVVPLLPSKEALTWEFRATEGADTYLIYINAMTGKEDVVLKVLRGDTGDVTL